MLRYWIYILTFACLLASVGSSFASETGTLRGSVRDASNQEALAEVQVSLESAVLPGGRVRMTDSKGNYWFPVLPPGDYRVTFSKDGYQVRSIEASVRLDQTTTLPALDLPLISYTSDVIEIIETAPILDTTQSAISENLSEEYLSRLPIGRSYQSAIRTLPGVSGRIDYSGGGPSNGNPSVRGEGQYGNNYLLEGFSTRDPLLKTVGFSLPFDALQEISVYTDGAPAEFGQFTGMVANILLKSGSNTQHGSAGYIFSTHASTGTLQGLGIDENGDLSVQEISKRRFLTHNPVATLSGPVVEDMLWYFASFSFQTGWDQLEGSTVRSETPYDYQFLSRFTYSPFKDSSTLLNFTVQKQKYLDKASNADALVAPEATADLAYDLLSLNANLKTNLSPYVVLEAKWNTSSKRFYQVQPNNDLLTPSVEDYYTGYVSGNTRSLYSTRRERTGFALHMTRYLTDTIGQHVLKGGYEFHQSNNTDEFTFTGGIGTPESPAYSYVEADGEPFQRYEFYNVGPLGHLGYNTVLFLQDQWQPVTSMTLNLGFRADNESLIQNAGRPVIEQWSFSPRFGMAWDVKSDANHVLAVNAGRYYDVNGLSFAEWADSRSAYYFTLCEWNAETQRYDQNCYTQDPVANPLSYSGELQPYFLDKFTLGYTRAFGSALALGIKGILSSSRNMPEDAQFNPSTWAIVNPELKRRDYWAVELSANRRWRDRWQLLSSFTYSWARGTNPGSFDSGFGDGNQVGVFMDDFADPYQRMTNDYFGIDFAGLGYTDFTAFGEQYSGNVEGWYGFLPEHSFVNLKLNGSYQFEWGTELGLVYEFDSGHAWQRRGNIPAYGYSTFPEGRGVRSMPPVHYVDMRLAQTFALKGSMSLTTELTVFNVLDLAQVINYYENFSQPYQVEAGEDGAIHYYDRNGNEINQNFGKPQYYQAPRSLRANLSLSF